MPLPLISQPELVDDLADKTGWTKGDVRNFLDALSNVITESVKGGKRLRLCGIQIEPRVRAKQKARMGRNPQTGADIQIPAKPASVKLGFRTVVPLSKVELPSVAKLTGGKEPAATKTKEKVSDKKSGKKNGKNGKKNSVKKKVAKKKGRK